PEEHVQRDRQERGEEDQRDRGIEVAAQLLLDDRLHRATSCPCGRSARSRNTRSSVFGSGRSSPIFHVVVRSASYSAGHSASAVLDVTRQRAKPSSVPACSTVVTPATLPSNSSTPDALASIATTAAFELRSSDSVASA